MTSTDLQKAIYAALSADPALSKVKIVKYYEEADGQYPFVVYKEISNVPAMHADNAEVAARVTYQISIVTIDDEYAIFEAAIKKTMRSLDFARVSSDDIAEDNEYIRCIRFSFTGEAE